MSLDLTIGLRLNTYSVQVPRRYYFVLRRYYFRRIVTQYVFLRLRNILTNLLTFLLYYV